jgi:hypothetical protein
MGVLITKKKLLGIFAVLVFVTSVGSVGASTAELDACRITKGGDWICPW